MSRSEAEILDSLIEDSLRRPIVFVPYRGTINMNLKYISHARTLEELRQELLSDLKRRLDNLDRLIAFEPTKNGKVKLESRKLELEDMVCFWQVVELKNERRKKIKEQIND